MKPKIKLEQEFWAKGSFTSEASLNVKRFAHLHAQLEIVLVNNNAHDTNAISLRIMNRHIGWVPLSKTKNFRSMFNSGYGATAKIDRISKDGDMVHISWVFAEGIPIGKTYEKPDSLLKKALNFMGL